MSTLPTWETERPIGTRTAQQIMDDVRRQHAQAVAAEEAVVGWPKPEKYARPTEDLPSSVAAVARMCDEWRATHARGPTGTNTAPGWRMADSYVLRGRVGERYFVALWLQKPKETKLGRKSFGLLFAYAHGIQGRLNAGQLERYLTEDDGLEWLKGVGFLSRTTN